MVHFVKRLVQQYGGTYAVFLSNAFAKALSFRIHFVLMFLLDVFFYVGAISSVSFLYDHVEKIGPWGREEFLFFLSFMLTVDCLHMAMLAPNFWNFSAELRQGTLDFYLVKPIGAVFVIFLRYLHPTAFLGGWIPVGLLLYYGTKIQLSVLSWCLLPLLILLAFLLLALTEILVSLVMFWTIDGTGINLLRIQLQRISRWPDFVFQAYFRRVFTVCVPVLMIGSYPARFLMDRSAWPLLLVMVVVIVVLWFLVGFVWKLGMQRYESASS